MEDFAYQRNAGRIVPTLNGQQVTPKEAVKYVCEQLRRHCLKDACLYMPPSKRDLLTQDNCFSTGPKGVVHNDIGKRFAHPKDMIYVPFTWENMARVMFYWLLWGPYNVIANNSMLDKYKYRLSPSSTFGNVIDLKLVYKGDYGPNTKYPNSCFIYHLPFSFPEKKQNEGNPDVRKFIKKMITLMALEEFFLKHDLDSRKKNITNTLKKLVDRFEPLSQAEFFKQLPEANVLLTTQIKKLREIIATEATPKEIHNFKARACMIPIYNGVAVKIGEKLLKAQEKKTAVTSGATGARLNAGAKAVVYIGGGTAIGLAFGGPVGAGVGAVVGGAVWGLVGLFS